MAPRRARALIGAGGDRDLREHLIEVTQQLLAEGGVEQLTTRRIARAASVADGVLYNYFADKDELILAALVARASGLLAAFREACPRAGADTVEANLARLAAAMLGLQEALLPLLVALLARRALLARFLAELHAPEIGGPDAVLDCVHAYLAEEARLGRLGSGSDAHVAGVLLFAITQLQALVTQFRGAGEGDADALRPFVHFLAQTLTTAHGRQPTRKGSKR